MKKLLIIRAMLIKKFAQLKWELNCPRDEIMEEISENFELRRVVLRIKKRRRVVFFDLKYFSISRVFTLSSHFSGCIFFVD